MVPIRKRISVCEDKDNLKNTCLSSILGPPISELLG